MDVRHVHPDHTQTSLGEDGDEVKQQVRVLGYQSDILLEATVWNLEQQIGTGWSDSTSLNCVTFVHVSELDAYMAMDAGSQKPHLKYAHDNISVQVSSLTFLQHSST